MKRTTNPLRQALPLAVAMIFCGFAAILGAALAASTARVKFTGASIQQIAHAPGGLDITAEAQGAVATFRCLAARTNFEICQALHPGMEVDLVGLPAAPDADEPVVELLYLFVGFEERGTGGGPGDSDKR